MVMTVEKICEVMSVEDETRWHNMRIMQREVSY